MSCAHTHQLTWLKALPPPGFATRTAVDLIAASFPLHPRGGATGNSLTFMNVMGLFVSVLGIAYYNRIKYRESQKDGAHPGGHSHGYAPASTEEDGYVTRTCLSAMHTAHWPLPYPASGKGTRRIANTQRDSAFLPCEAPVKRHGCGPWLLAT